MIEQKWKAYYYLTTENSHIVSRRKGPGPWSVAGSLQEKEKVSCVTVANPLPGQVD